MILKYFHTLILTATVSIWITTPHENTVYVEDITGLVGNHCN